MSKKTSLLNNAYTHLLFTALLGIASLTTAYGKDTPNNKENTSTKNTTSKSISASEKDEVGNPIINSSNEPVEKEFDQIRTYQSYDPATNIWSQIQDFKTIEILEDSTQHRSDHYIYHSFWAYDTQHKKWKRVDIRDYGYRYGKYVPTPSSSTKEDQADKIEKDKKDSPNFWKNLGFTFLVGGGGTYYYNQLNGLDLMVKKATGELYAQVPSSSDTAQGKAHLIRWFYNGNKKIRGVKNKGAFNDEYEPISAGDINFRGIGLNIPITMGLHYTFFKKLRVGAGGNFEINYLKELTPRGKANGMAPYEPPINWVYNLKWFGTIGYKIFKRPKYAIVLDTQLGVVFDLGDSPKQNLFQLINPPTFHASLGIAYERKMNDYFKLIYRLSGDFKEYSNTADFIPNDASINLYQPALHLEIGGILNFGRNIDEEDDADNTENTAEDTGKDQDSTLNKVEDIAKKADEGLNKAAKAKSMITSDKKKLKGLF
jgi:hypothetical protein